MLSGRCELDDLSVLSVNGRDAVAFLRCQLSQDMTRLEAGHAHFAGRHTPQGQTEPERPFAKYYPLRRRPATPAEPAASVGRVLTTA